MTLLATITALILASSPASACAELDLDAVIAQARARWGIDGAPAVVGAMQVAWDGLGGSCDSPTDVQLAQFTQLAGSLAFYEDDELTARAWFIRAATLTPHIPFGEGLGPEAKAAYEEILSGLRIGDRSYIKATRPIQVDGVEIARRRELVVAPGAHLVELPGDSADVQWVTLLPSQRITLPEADGLELKHLGWALGGTGAAVTAAGLAIYVPTRLGPWRECMDLATTSSPQECEDAVGSNVVARVKSSRALLVVGGGLTAAGGAVLVSPQLSVGSTTGLTLRGVW